MNISSNRVAFLSSHARQICHTSPVLSTALTHGRSSCYPSSRGAAVQYALSSSTSTSVERCHVRMGCSAFRRLPAIKSAATSPEGVQEEGEEEEEEEEKEEGLDKDPMPELELPSQYYQKVLVMKDVKGLRSISNNLAKEGTLQRIICGQNGITQSFLNACADVLGKHEFLRVKLGEGSGLERKQAAKILEKHLDAVSVHEVGFTITLHRRSGLPRPSNCPAAPAPMPSGLRTAAVQAAPPASLEPEIPQIIPKQRTSLKSAERAAAAKALAKLQPKGPPQISVLK